MNGRDFLPVALHLSAEATEAAWRSAISRAYYAVFHVARGLLRDLRFVVPRSDRAHPYLVYRLSNCGELSVARAGFERFGSFCRSARLLAPLMVSPSRFRRFASANPFGGIDSHE